MSPARLSCALKNRLRHDAEKITYAIQRDAQKAIIRLNGGTLLEYRCFCLGRSEHWHIGHFKAGRRPLQRHPMLDIMNDKLL